MQALKQTPTVDQVMVEGMEKFLGTEETARQVAEHIGYNLDYEDTPEGWLQYETDMHACHVHVIDDEEFFNRYFGEL